MEINKLKEALENKIIDSEKVVIIPHNSMDFDAIASAIGLSLASSYFNKDSFISYDSNFSFDSGVDIIFNESYSKYNIISKDEYLNIMDNNDLYILTDVNKHSLISFNEFLNADNTFVIDHHTIGSDTVLSNNTYVDPKMSSASEIVANLLLELGISIPKDVANYLLAGIVLDTNKLTKNVSANVFDVASYLSKCGAKMSEVSEYFTEDFVSDRRVQNLVSKLSIMTYNIALMVANDNDRFTKDELAKAANYALNYKVDASFAIGKLNNEEISISARSKERLDVGNIMEMFGGGGNVYSGAAKFSNGSVQDVQKKLVKILSHKI